MKTLKAMILVVAAFFVVMGFTRGAWASPQSALPDLTVVNVESDAFCRLRITLANIGDGEIPGVDFEDVAVRVENRSGNPYSGFMMLVDIDPTRKLARPHSTLTFIWSPHGRAFGYLHSGTNHIIVTVDDFGLLGEADENNNSLERDLTCQITRGGANVGIELPPGTTKPYPIPPNLPDLAVVKVERDFMCRLKITLANIGGNLPPIAYNPTTNGVAISVTSGNTSLGFMRLCDADPMKKLRLFLEICAG